MRRKPEVRLHSPISEGEEGQRGAGMGLSTSEDEETQQHGAGAGSPCAAASSETHAVLPYSGSSSSSDAIRSDHESHVLPGFNAVSGTHFLAEGTDSALSQSALQTQTMARTQPAGVDTTLTIGAACLGENDLSSLAVCSEADTGSGTHADELLSQPAPLDHETQTESLFHSGDLLMNPLTAEILETPHMQLPDTATNSNTHLSDINTASSSHTCFFGSAIACNCCQESQLSGSLLDGQGPEENQTYGSSKAEISVWSTELVLEDGATQLGLAEMQPGLDEETLQWESKKMVDDILKNALAALERIDASERESETPLSNELNESAETLMLMGAGDSVDGSASLEQMFQERSHVQADGNPRLNLSDDTLGGRVQTDGSRSTPSSGYESIAGSDTDIRGMVMSADITSSSWPISTHCTEPELREKTGTECCTGETELCMEESPVCRNIGQNSVQSVFLLEEREGPARIDANNELLFHYELSDSNISHKTNITSAQPTLSESLSGVNRGKEWRALEDHRVRVSVAENENGDAGPNNAAKVNTESNNYGHALGLDSGDASPNINNFSQVQSFSKSLSPNEVGNFEVRDFSENEDRPSRSVSQTHVTDGTTAPLSVPGDPELASLGPQSGQSDTESSFALVKTYLATVVEDGPESEMESGEMTSADPGRTQLVSLDNTADLTAGCSSVKVFVCGVSDDQSQDHEPESSLQCSSRFVDLPVSVRAHLDIPGTSCRQQAMDLHQGPRGFTIISEEEELDAVFVNDTGPLLSPSTRRAKAYPFSLSPIYEEDSGREDISREDILHVPPATEEEQRSVEQQASSVLSLLQSVSERLQSSGFSNLEDAEEKLEQLEELECPQRFLRPLWDRYDDDDAAADEESDLLLQQQLTGVKAHSEESEHAEEECVSPGFSPDRETPQGGDSGAKQFENNLNNASNAAKSGKSPFYEYLKSSIVPSFDSDKQASKSDLYQKRAAPTSTAQVTILFKCIFLI